MLTAPRVPLPPCWMSKCRELLIIRRLGATNELSALTRGTGPAPRHVHRLHLRCKEPMGNSAAVDEAERTKIKERMADGGSTKERCSFEGIETGSPGAKEQDTIRRRGGGCEGGVDDETNMEGEGARTAGRGGREARPGAGDGRGCCCWGWGREVRRGEGDDCCCCCCCWWVERRSEEAGPKGKVPNTRRFSGERWVSIKAWGEGFDTCANITNGSSHRTVNVDMGGDVTDSGGGGMDDTGGEVEGTAEGGGGGVEEAANAAAERDTSEPVRLMVGVEGGAAGTAVTTRAEGGVPGSWPSNMRRRVYVGARDDTHSYSQWPSRTATSPLGET
mmetsp:Transcript_22837/g.37585  ORF Transcript_22837/g.37585 Transcript_22837/m.37585 type:complete len:332 (+) Transcript_22837:364-1359(+)